METIVLEVPFDVAKQRLLQSMDAMSQTALERGMTEEILDNILKEASYYESESHAKAVKRLMKTVETIGLRAEERGMTDQIFEELLKYD